MGGAHGARFVETNTIRNIAIGPKIKTGSDSMIRGERLDCSIGNARRKHKRKE